MHKAFVLGAGLGTRLKSLTQFLPKPLLPVWHRPLITFAFDHLAAVGVREFVINTHHLPRAYDEAFPERAYRGAPLTFVHEPVLLETGGGLANVAGYFQDDSFAVYNGDVLTDVPLQSAWERHVEDGNLVTLVLKSYGAVQNVAFDPSTGRVLDLRNALGTNYPLQCQFTGIYFVHPAFFRFLIPGRIESVVLGFLRAIQAGERIGGVLADEGDWWDLGDRESYLDAHAAVKNSHFPRHAAWNGAWKTNVHPEAEVGQGARIDGVSCAGAFARVGADAILTDCILWPGARVKPNSNLKRCIVRTGQVAEGTLENVDV